MRLAAFLLQVMPGVLPATDERFACGAPPLPGSGRRRPAPVIGAAVPRRLAKA